MSNIQFSNQENQANFKNQPQAKKPRGMQGGSGNNFRFVPIAIICAFVFVGAVIFAKLQTEKRLNENSYQADLTGTGITGNLLRENPVQPQDQLVATTAAQLPPEATTASHMRISGLGGTPVPTPTPTPTPVAAVITPTPVVVRPTPTPIITGPVITNPNHTTTNNNTQTNTTTETRTVTVGSDDTYKPANPYMETCGEFRDNRWHDLKVVLPKFERDGKAAVEYWVQVGTEVGSNNIFDKRFSQTDRVVFAESYDNSRDYYVRFAIRMDGGDWQKWSNTLRLRCEMK